MPDTHTHTLMRAYAYLLVFRAILSVQFFSAVYSHRVTAKREKKGIAANFRKGRTHIHMHARVPLMPGISSTVQFLRLRKPPLYYQVRAVIIRCCCRQRRKKSSPRARARSRIVCKEHRVIMRWSMCVCMCLYARRGGLGNYKRRGRVRIAFAGALLRMCVRFEICFFNLVPGEVIFYCLLFEYKKEGGC